MNPIATAICRCRKTASHSSRVASQPAGTASGDQPCMRSLTGTERFSISQASASSAASATTAQPRAAPAANTTDATTQTSVAT